MSVKQLFDLTGRKAIVTGGSRGLGFQMALALGEMGAELLLTARKKDELDAAVARLAQSGIEASAIPCDLGDPAGLRSFAAEALDRLGHCDILVNNAGATWGAPAEDHPLDAWQKVVDLNLTSVFLMCQAIGKASMIPRRYGRILNISSTAGLHGNIPGTAKTVAYNTTKAGIINLTRALAGEWGAFGITVNALAPGVFPTKMSKAYIDRTYAAELRRIPLGRLGDDQDLMGPTVLLCSEAGKHITGHVLVVDGGASVVG